MATAIDQVRPAKFVAAVNVISDFVRNNHEFFADLETWKQTDEKSSLIVSFIEMFNLFTLTERKRFVEVLKVMSMVLEEDGPSNL
jgi:hypothetical protein